MSPRSARYRVHQFFEALRARREPPDISPARDVLAPPLLALFEGMPAEDQRHVLTVLSDLQARGETGQPLLEAALLHDLGKAGAGVGLLHRVARVLLWRSWPAAWAWLSASATGWRRPFWVVANHAERGAVWVESQGGSAELVALVRQHELPAPEAWQGSDLAGWHAALAWADARS